MVRTKTKIPSKPIKKARKKPQRVSPIPKQPEGRPPIYDSKVHPELAHKFCLLGCTNERLGQLLGVSTISIENWIRQYDEFFRAIKEGREIADANVAKSLYHRACGYTHEDVHISAYQGEVLITPIVKHYPPDVGAATLWLTNRTKQLSPDKRWTVNQQQQIDYTSGGEKISGPVINMNMSLKEACDLYLNNVKRIG